MPSPPPTADTWGPRRNHMVQRSTRLPPCTYLAKSSGAGASTNGPGYARLAYVVSASA